MILWLRERRRFETNVSMVFRRQIRFEGFTREALRMSVGRRVQRDGIDADALAVHLDDPDAFVRAMEMRGLDVVATMEDGLASVIPSASPERAEQLATRSRRRRNRVRIVANLVGLLLGLTAAGASSGGWSWSVAFGQRALVAMGFFVGGWIAGAVVALRSMAGDLDEAHRAARSPTVHGLVLVGATVGMLALSAGLVAAGMEPRLALCAPVVLWVGGWAGSTTLYLRPETPR